MARSLRPPLKLPVFIFHYCTPETFFTVSSTFSPSTNTKPVVMAESTFYSPFRYQYFQGFICCSSPRYDLVTIYNPTTRQCVHLPKIKPVALSQKRSHCSFRYDHVMNQYKVLAMITDYKELTQIFHVFTLGRDDEWRKIQGNIDEKLFPVGHTGVCIDGTIYYGAVRVKERENFGETMLLSFDVMSERFYHVRAPDTLLEAIRYDDRKLFNHMGKLARIVCSGNETSTWIMENAEKQEWSMITFDLPEYQESDFRTSSSLETRKQRRPKPRVFAIHDYVENTMWL